MTAALTPDQTEAYWTDGYVNRLVALTPDEAAEQLAAFERIEAETVAAHGGEWKQRDYRPWEHADHPFRDWIDGLVRHPRVLDFVESILGPDILIRNADIFVKNPGIRRGINWHVDTAEKGPDADRLLTVWLGLTDSTDENGGLHYAAGSHRQLLPDAPKDKWNLTLSPTAVSALDRSREVINVMEAGMMSMHHFSLVHASGPNRTTRRRVGFVGRYMAPAIQASTAESGVATLLRGRDTHGHFTLKDRFPMTWTM